MCSTSARLGHGRQRVLRAVLAVCLCLGGCDDPRERVTCNHIYQLAFSAALLHEELSACDWQGSVAAEHGRAWNKALTAAEGWIGLSRESIAARLAAGREAFKGVGEALCPKVLERANASLAQAKRLEERIAARHMCSLMGCT
ncbi:MAG: hypothetical protein ACK5YW_13290 [Betaproteobacteria bacterium]|jgi:hypothetical protein|nr:hypothetical protein [Rhodocyclaceae bacterium]MCA3135271.1 hypothetical protein [Rhodocyclaceae bacterium]MCA3141679.1 hypothetical protein [Rhodocyclaceae bacterium]MCA3145303.1 hypothetical protein [Rhodocyclaceae bacterium]MCE2896823.1 hypothetical protein [Betaproteobacteria bacterium]